MQGLAFAQGLNCSQRQYLSNGRCCNRCPPGRVWVWGSCLSSAPPQWAGVAGGLFPSQPSPQRPWGFPAPWLLMQRRAPWVSPALPGWGRFPPPRWPLSRPPPPQRPSSRAPRPELPYSALSLFLTILQARRWRPPVRGSPIRPAALVRSTTSRTGGPDCLTAPSTAPAAHVSAAGQGGSLCSPEPSCPAKQHHVALSLRGVLGAL